MITVIGRLRDGWRLPRELSEADRTMVFSLLANAQAKAIARGSFIALSVIYLANGLQLNESQIALAVFVAGAFGLVGSLFGGFIADQWSPKVLALVTSLGVVGGYAALALRADFLTAVVAFSVVAIFDRSTAAILGTWVGQRLPTRAATRSRALMRAVSNLGIAIGAAAVAAALVLFEPFPYDALFIGMACAEGLGVFFLLRAPQPRRARATPRSNVGAFSVFGNRGFTVFVVGIAAISTLYLILDFLLPLWISTASSHDIVLIPTAIVINTTLVVLFQVPVSSTSDTPTRAAKALGFAGGLLLSAALLFALSAVTVSVTAAVVFCIAVAVLTFAELLTSAAGWTLSYAYAPPERIGAYQGVFGFGTSLGVMTAPIALTAIVIRPSAESTALGWALLGGGYALIGLLLWIMVRRHFFNTTLRPSAAQ